MIYSSSDRQAFSAKMRDIAVSACPNSKLLESEESWFTDDYESVQATLAMSQEEIDGVLSDVQMDERPKYRKLELQETPSDAKEHRICVLKSRKFAELRFKENPLDLDNLIRWASALLALSPYEDGIEAKIKMIKEAVSKLKMVLVVKPRKHEALWCLGKAHTIHGLHMPDFDTAMGYFEKAAKYFQQAVDEDPSNDIYNYCLQWNAKAPEWYTEMCNENLTLLHRLGGEGFSTSSYGCLALEWYTEMCNQNLALLHRLGGEGFSTSSYGKGSMEEKFSDYDDTYGWTVWAAVATIAMVVFIGKSH